MQTNPTGAQTWSIYKNGVTALVGNVFISTGGVVTFSSVSGAAVSFAAGDMVVLVGSATVDATLSYVDIVLQGGRDRVTSTPIIAIPAGWLGQARPSQLIRTYTFTNAATFASNFNASGGA